MTLLRNLFGLTLIAACVLAPASAQPAGYDRAWDGPVDGTEDWFDRFNWEPDNIHPQAGEKILISPNTTGQLTLFIEIAGQDAACETIDMDHPTGTFLKLVIKGQTLTLGDASTDTTSVIDGEFVFEEVASNPGKLEVHNWVTFSVPVNGFCTFTAKEPAEFIRASSDGVGVEFAEGSGTLDVSGQFQFLVSVKHDATFFGVTKGVMSFGLLNGAAFNPVLQISGASLNAKEFVAQTGGRMEFHEVDFASTAPSWLVTGLNSEIRATATLNNVPNDIKIEFNGLLNLRDNFTCNGKLTHQNGTIRVKAGKHALIESGV